MAKILIVDDDQSIGFMIKDILEFNGHEIIVSQQPKETRENIIKHDVDLVILDKLISGVDGTEVCAELRKDDKLSEIPVLMMSALHNIGDQCREAGATDFLPKPFDMETLIAKTNDLLEEAKKK